MRKTFLLSITALVVLAVSGGVALGQQRSLYSQFMFNRLAFNPAEAGAYSYIPVHLSLRRQWAGIKEAPRVQNLSAHGYVGRGVGLGVNLFNQEAGPTRFSGLEFSSSYTIDFSAVPGDRDHTLAFGLSAVLLQYVIDRDKLTTDIPDDPLIQRFEESQLLPDANAGILYRNRNFFVGFAGMNLVQTRRYQAPSRSAIFNQVQRTYYLNVGYKWDISENFAWQPSALFQTIEPLLQLNLKKGDVAIPFQLDVNNLFYWRNTLFAGFSYRSQDAISGHLGFQRPAFRVAYSYDYATSDLNNYNHGSHEISLTLFIETGGGGGPRARGSQIPRRTLQFQRD